MFAVADDTFEAKFKNATIGLMSAKEYSEKKAEMEVLRLKKMCYF